MRRRSITNSRPWECLQLRADYREANPVCELSKLLRAAKLILTEDDSAEVHHIFGGNGRRIDCVSNLLTVNRTVHDWLHAHPVDGRLICLHTKLVKCELDLEEFRRCSGKYLGGWLDMMHPIHPLAVSARAELMAMEGTA